MMKLIDKEVLKWYRKNEYMGATFELIMLDTYLKELNGEADSIRHLRKDIGKKFRKSTPKLRKYSEYLNDEEKWLNNQVGIIEESLSFEVRFN